MGTQTSAIYVGDAAQMRQAVDSYIVQGYSVATQDAQSATMRKAKEFQVLWAVIGFFLCLLPLLIYLVVYATQSDQVVRIVVGNQGQAALTLSSDGNWWWSFEQQRWVGVLEQLPAGSRRSDDGQWWWDGADWRRIPSPQDANADGRITTDDASPSPHGEPGAEAQQVWPRPGEPLPPPTS